MRDLAGRSPKQIAPAVADRPLPTPLVRATAASLKERGSFSQVKCSDRASFYQPRLARRRQACRPFNRRRSRLQAGAPVACSQCTQTQETRHPARVGHTDSHIGESAEGNKVCSGPSAGRATGTTARQARGVQSVHTESHRFDRGAGRDRAAEVGSVATVGVDPAGHAAGAHTVRVLVGVSRRRSPSAPTIAAASRRDTPPHTMVSAPSSNLARRASTPSNLPTGRSVTHFRPATRLLRAERSGSAAERLDHLPEQKSAGATGIVRADACDGRTLWQSRPATRRQAVPAGSSGQPNRWRLSTARQLPRVRRNPSRVARRPAPRCRRRQRALDVYLGRAERDGHRGCGPRSGSGPPAHGAPGPARARSGVTMTSLRHGSAP